MINDRDIAKKKKRIGKNSFVRMNQGTDPNELITSKVPIPKSAKTSLGEAIGSKLLHGFTTIVTKIGTSPIPINLSFSIGTTKRIMVPRMLI